MTEERAKDAEVAALLRAALEKIVFFEWRISELQGELAAAQSRCASAEAARAEADGVARAAQQASQTARRQLAELEAERARMATLLSRPGHAQIDTQALEAERQRAAQLEADLAAAREQLERNRAERERWLAEMIDQARSGEEAPAALAQFISELRGEVIALRERQRQCDALLDAAGVTPPAPVNPEPHPAPSRPPPAVEEARKMMAEGRLGAEISVALPSGTAASALTEQCLKALGAPESARRAQAARHLAAVPFAGAAPALVTALHAEHDPKARAQLAKALAACGGASSAEIVASLQAPHEHALVRLAALEALCAVPEKSAAALRVAAHDEAAAVRRRAAALATALGDDAVLALLSADADASVRAACDVKEAAPVREVPVAAPADPASEALLAIQSAMFGLTEDELAQRTGLDEGAVKELAGRLVAEGRLGRRGKRLVLAEGGAA